MRNFDLVLDEIIAPYCHSNANIAEAVDKIREAFEAEGYSRVKTYYFAFDDEARLTLYTGHTSMRKAIERTAKTIHQIKNLKIVKEDLRQ